MPCAEAAPAPNNKANATVDNNLAFLTGSSSGCPPNFPTMSRPRAKTFAAPLRFRRLRNGNVHARHGHCVPSSTKATFIHQEETLAILSSSIDNNTAEFRANAERMRSLVSELRARRAEAA